MLMVCKEECRDGIQVTMKGFLVSQEGSVPVNNSLDTALCVSVRACVRACTDT